jgi:hypothetical protein
MSTDNHRTVAQHFIIDVVGAGRIELIDELTTPRYVDRSLPSGVTLAQSIAAFRAGFPDVRFTIQADVAERDVVVIRWTAGARTPANSLASHRRHLPVYPAP